VPQNACRHASGVSAVAFLRPSTRMASLGLSDVRDRTAIGHAAARDPAHRRYGSVGARTSGIRQNQRLKSTACVSIAFYDPSSQKRNHSGDKSDSRGAASSMQGGFQCTSDRSDEAATWSDSGEAAGQRQLQRQVDTISHLTGRSRATQWPRLTGDSQKLSREEMIRQRRIYMRYEAPMHPLDNIGATGRQVATKMREQYHKSTQRHCATLRRHVRRWCDSGPG
jgi:hypothetical protein